MRVSRRLAVVVFFSVLCAASASAQVGSPICTVTGAENAALSGTRLSQGTAVFSGEQITTQDHGQALVQCGGVHLALSENSAMRPFQNGTKILVELERGTLIYATPGNSEDLTIYGLDIRIVPHTEKPAAGQVSSPSHCRISIRPSRSSVTVTSGRESKVIEESKAYEVTADLGVTYRDTWKPMSADYPDFARDAEYHHSHDHVACAPAYANQTSKPPVLPIVASHFREIAIGIAVAVTVPIINEVLESSDRP